MTTALDLLNDTLDALGEPAVVSATLTSTSSDWVKRASRALTRAAKIVAESHPWNWMTEIVQLQETATETPIGWQYEFNKPANCQRIVKISIDGGWYSRPISYEDRSGLLLTNSETSYLHHVDQARLDLYGSWPEKFAHAVALEAAHRACFGTNKSRGVKDDLKSDKKEALAEAKTFDGQQQPAKPRYAGTWVNAAAGGWKSRENG